MNSKRIGILGGMSYKSTIKYYELILEKYYEKERNYHYPEIIIFSLNFQKLIDYELMGNKDEYIKYLLGGIISLENSGADLIIMAANSPHAVFNELRTRTNVKILSIIEATAEKAKKEKVSRVLLLGIKFTMQSTFYQDHFKKLGIEVLTPREEEQDEIDKIIFDELVIGLFKEQSKKRIIEIINNYNIEAVILGCTELPLLIKQKDLKIKILDTVDIHVSKTLDYFLSKL
ncbi:MAG: aspartate/glutamate racemase family protein [Candidatus Thorarchaeota archaeon]